MSDPWAPIFSSAPEREIPDGSTLFHRDDAITDAYFVREGVVRLERTLSDGTQLTLDRSAAGTLLARASLFADRYHCDAVADVRSRVAILPRAAVLKAMQGSDIVQSVLAASAHDVQALRARIEVIRLKTLSARLDAYLDLKGHPPRGGWVAVADWIGVTPAALYRELSKRRGSDRRG